MSDWYFEKNGERAGPVSADEIKAMAASGAIELTNLVWTASFGSEWKRLSDTELAPPQPILPPPLPGKEPPALQNRLEPPAPGPNDFLDSELTKALVGKKQDYYLAKWRAILEKAGGDPTKVAAITSWNWAALCIPYFWLLYRKLYVLGGIVLAVQLAYILLPDSVPTSLARSVLLATIALSVAFALYGNAWYLDAVRKRWETLRQDPNQASAIEKARSAGGVTLVAPVGALVIVIAAAVVPYLILPGLPVLAGGRDPVALVRQGHMTDYPTTTVGKAFVANFDEGSWRSFTTAKGQRIVEFTGKISETLHKSAQDGVFEALEELRKSAKTKEEAEQLDLNYRLNIFQVALRYLDGKPVLQRLLQKWECGKIEQVNLAGPWVGKMPNCKEHLSEFLGDAIDEWATEGHWPVGTSATVQFIISVDGASFELTHLASAAWEGKEEQHVLDLLFK